MFKHSFKYCKSAQQWATQMSSMNPEFVQQMRERMNISKWHLNLN
jgi:hypothetical protein